MLSSLRHYFEQVCARCWNLYLMAVAQHYQHFLSQSYHHKQPRMLRLPLLSLFFDQSATSNSRTLITPKSLRSANLKQHKKPFFPPHLSYFLEVQLRKCMEPIGNLANVEELDLKTGQKTRWTEKRASVLHHQWKSWNVYTMIYMIITHVFRWPQFWYFFFFFKWLHKPIWNMERWWNIN